MRLISRLEEIILLSIWRLQDNAYGITILEEVKKANGDARFLDQGRKISDKMRSNDR